MFVSDEDSFSPGSPPRRNQNTRVASLRRLKTLQVTRRSVLRVVRGAGEGTVLQLGEGPSLAGRSEVAELIIDDPAASRRHFEVAPSHGSYVLRDLGSTNGTQVNRVTVVECRLANGDIITVGETDVAFVEETAVASPNPS
jgi:pSer/pThr/pTyr-binding forkhead associated (FHA) protein